MAWSTTDLARALQRPLFHAAFQARGRDAGTLRWLLIELFFRHLRTLLSRSNLGFRIGIRCLDELFLTGTQYAAQGIASSRRPAIASPHS
jgi:hypothetical protein